MDSAQPAVFEGSQPVQRRRKARLACKPCRARKTGCDGRRPVCSACSLRGWEDKCGYPDSVMQSSAALTLVELDRRLQKLENGTRAETGVPTSYATQTAAIIASLGKDPGDGSTMFTDDDESTTATLATSELALDTLPDLFGYAMQTPDHLPDDVDPAAMVLPEREFADELLQWYWLNAHPIFSFLNWPVFESKYRSLWTQHVPSNRPPVARDDVVFLAILNMILAQACLRNAVVPSADRRSQADEYYKRSLRLISVETMDCASCEVVQLLLLRALYLYFSGRADRAWPMSGTAVRVAVALGLHATPDGSLSQMEREMRRRIWYAGCVMVDRTVGCTFGRPSMTAELLGQTRLPQAIDEEYLSETGEGRQPEDIPSRMDHTIFSSRFLDIVRETHAAVSMPRLNITQHGRERPVPDPSAVLRVNSLIDDFADGLPPYLCARGGFSGTGLKEDAARIFRVQQHAVRTRMLLLRLVLLRPSILAEANWGTPWTEVKKTARVLLRFHLEVCSLCVTVAHAVLENFHERLPMIVGISAWDILHFTFTAASALLLATLSPKLEVDLDAEPAKTSWDRAIAIFHFYQAEIPSAARGIQVLQHFRESLLKRARARTAAGTKQSLSDDMDTYGLTPEQPRHERQHLPSQHYPAQTTPPQEQPLQQQQQQQQQQQRHHQQEYGHNVSVTHSYTHTPTYNQSYGHSPDATAWASATAPGAAHAIPTPPDPPPGLMDDGLDQLFFNTSDAWASGSSGMGDELGFLGHLGQPQGGEWGGPREGREAAREQFGHESRQGEAGGRGDGDGGHEGWMLRF